MIGSPFQEFGRPFSMFPNTKPMERLLAITYWAPILLSANTMKNVSRRSMGNLNNECMS